VPTLEVSEETLAKIKEQLGVDSFKEINTYEDLVGQKFFFRTVTYFLTGEVKKIVGRFVYLKNAAVIFDTGRFMEAIKNGTLNEVEPVGEAFVNMDSVTDFFPWKHTLPTDQK
jgi:hypothetical protein